MMTLVEWFYVVIAIGIAWVVLSFPYLVEKLVRTIKELWS
jgi:hypothetical protein